MGRRHTCHHRRAPHLDAHARIPPTCTPSGECWWTQCKWRSLGQTGPLAISRPGICPLGPLSREVPRSDQARRASREVPSPAWDRKWVTHVQQIGRGDHAVRYLAQYIFRVALTNDRIEHLSAKHVTFRYTHAKTGELRRESLSIDAFLTRFLQHTLPQGFTKVRWSGLLSPGNRSALERARAILETNAAATRLTAANEVTETRDECADNASTDNAFTCPACNSGILTLIERIPRTRAPP